MPCQSQIDLEPWTIIRRDLTLPYRRDNLSPTVYGLHQILILGNSIGLAQTPLYQSKTVLGSDWVDVATLPEHPHEHDKRGPFYPHTRASNHPHGKHIFLIPGVFP